MNDASVQRQKIIHSLLSLGVVRKGLFTLKSGRTSSTYFNLRLCMSHPRLLDALCKYMGRFVLHDRRYDYVSGVAYGGVPLACVLSSFCKIPQIFVRGDAKKHGLGCRIEGLRDGWEKRGKRVLLVEDVITTGQSVVAVADLLKAEGFEVEIVCIVDRRGEGGTVDIGYPMHVFLKECDFDEGVPCSIENRLYRSAFERHTNLFFSADLDTMDAIGRVLEEIHSDIVGVKLHSDIITDFNVEEVLRWKRRYGILVIEDMKLGDIGSISLKKVGRVASYADYITYHPVVGQECVLLLKQAFPTVGLLCVAEMSVVDSFSRDDLYIRYALEQRHWNDGYVLQRRGIQLLNDVACGGNTAYGSIPTFSPGILYREDEDTTSSGMKDTTSHTSPTVGGDAEEGRLGEFWIVGRGIYGSSDTATMAVRYREDGWRYFLDACW